MEISHKPIRQQTSGECGMQIYGEEHCIGVMDNLSHKNFCLIIDITEHLIFSFTLVYCIALHGHFMYIWFC